MVNLRVSVDIGEALNALRNAPERVERTTVRWIPRAGQLGVAHIRRAGKAKFKRPKGPLLGSVRAEILGGEAVISPNVPYGAWVNDGTKPHFIFPKNAHALFWRSGVGSAGPVKRRSNAGKHFAAWVYHPGFEGHRYMEDAAASLEPEATDLLRSMLTQEFASS